MSPLVALTVETITGGGGGAGLGLLNMTRANSPPMIKTKIMIATTGHHRPFRGGVPPVAGGGETPPALAGFGVSSGMAFLSVRIYDRPALRRRPIQSEATLSRSQKNRCFF